MEEFEIVECIVCHKNFDERDVFVTMGITYCPVDVAYVMRNRLNTEDRERVLDIIDG